MRIIQRRASGDLHAYKVGKRAFKCFPKSCNDKMFARDFTAIEEAAVFLIQNPTWGIRMNPGGGIIYDNIVIER